MESNQISGILAIILGLFFIVCPLITSSIVSILIGVSLLFLGIISILTEFTAVNAIFGVLAIIFGLLFIFNIDALSFILGLQLYIIGILLVLIGIVGIFSDKNFSTVSSVLIIILGIIAFFLGGYAWDNRVVVAIIIGICLVIQGVRLYVAD